MSEEALSYQSILGVSQGEFKAKGSRFLALAFPVRTPEEALEQVVLAKKEHPKARHHCYAYRIGHDGQNYRANDDGEPSGTAGKPILGQIDSHGVCDVCVVVVRYFGGTLLGTSGLIQAYREAAKDALSRASLVRKWVTVTCRVDCEPGSFPLAIEAAKRCKLTYTLDTRSEIPGLELVLPLNLADETLKRFLVAYSGLPPEMIQTDMAWKGIRISPLTKPSEL